jgi:DNA (cytosine-5)-methyltransferase 1
MDIMRILNLYSGIGGNRKLWGGSHEITAVEYNQEIADIYKDLFPNDTVIVADAQQYLLDHYKEFDFIWSSPPCPTHSRARYWGWHNSKPVYPDMSLYQIIIFLQTHFDNKWVVENVKPYYKPLIAGREIGRHIFWSNFIIPYIKHESSDIRKLSGTSFKDKLKRNAVDPELGLHILNSCLSIITKQSPQQTSLFT